MVRDLTIVSLLIRLFVEWVCFCISLPFARCGALLALGLARNVPYQVRAAPPRRGGRAPRTSSNGFVSAIGISQKKLLSIGPMYLASFGQFVTHEVLRRASGTPLGDAFPISPLPLPAREGGWRIRSLFG